MITKGQDLNTRKSEKGIFGIDYEDISSFSYSKETNFRGRENTEHAYNPKVYSSPCDGQGNPDLRPGERGADVRRRRGE